MLKIILLLFTFIFSFTCFCQSASDSIAMNIDSTRFKIVQEKLIGCWKTRYSQFRYQINLGMEFKSRSHSSAPIFNLRIKNQEVFIVWIELTGGEHLQKVISITKNKLVVQNEENLEIVYKRNSDCSCITKGP